MQTPRQFYFAFILFVSLITCLADDQKPNVVYSVPKAAPQWEGIEFSFEIDHRCANPYTQMEGHVSFVHQDGLQINRPIFWDGGKRFVVRFSSPVDAGQWKWTLEDVNLSSVSSPISGQLEAVPSQNQNVFSKHGFWTIPTGSRQIEYRDGSSVVLVADTAWALPWRATPEQVVRYAKDRQMKGFNAALLMTIQPDKKATGPRKRTADEGFARAFEDLPEGTLEVINVDFFQYLDELIEILRAHEIVPVFQPVFHGYGWKGLDTAGNELSVDDYSRFCKYLVARYGAGASIWLIGGDGIGNAPSLNPAGWMVEICDDYKHPAGMHYAPHGITDSFQGENWLDFQWAQTGHNGEHLPEIADRLYHQMPYKAVANGEPTYEEMGTPGKASGWWQGHEAWSNLTAGGTMGVVYGAGSLWNWVLRPDEPGHFDWTVAKGKAWYEAMEFKGSEYVGNLGKILNQYDVKGMEPNVRIAPARRGLSIPGELLILYLSNGGGLWFPPDIDLPEHFRIYDPKTTEVLAEGTFQYGSEEIPGVLTSLENEPRIVIFYELNRIKKDL